MEHYIQSESNKAVPVEVVNSIRSSTPGGDTRSYCLSLLLELQISEHCAKFLSRQENLTYTGTVSTDQQLQCVQVIVKIRKKRMDLRNHHLPTTLDVHLSERPEVLSEDCMKSDLRRHCSKYQIVVKLSTRLMSFEKSVKPIYRGWQIVAKF